MAKSKIKKVLKHITEDSKDFRKQLKDDEKLKKELLKSMKKRKK